MILFSLLWILVAGFIAFTIITMLIQMVLFGTVFHTVTWRNLSMPSWRLTMRLGGP